MIRTAERLLRRQIRPRRTRETQSLRQWMMALGVISLLNHKEKLQEDDTAATRGGASGSMVAGDPAASEESILSVVVGVGDGSSHYCVACLTTS